MMKRNYKKTGLPPGSLIHVGEEKTEKTKITVLDYNETDFREIELEQYEECFPFKDTPSVSWINIDGVHEAKVIEKIGTHFGLHFLVMEDIMNTSQRQKLEVYEDHIFIVLNILYHDEDNGQVVSEQISLVLGTNFVLSFKEGKRDIFNPIRERIKWKKGRIRLMHADYLAYALIDTVVDNYFVIMEKMGDDLEALNDELFDRPDPKTQAVIHRLKKEIIFLRKSIWPLRDVISKLERGESELIQEKTTLFFRDVYDHTVITIETVETFRDMLANMFDLYLSNISFRMNEVIKILTIIATLFIPLTFIVGIYGMNFKYMPELEWHMGYPLILITMVLIGLGMIFYFRRKHWF